MGRSTTGKWRCVEWGLAVRWFGRVGCGQSPPSEVGSGGAGTLTALRDARAFVRLAVHLSGSPGIYLASRAFVWLSGHSSDSAVHLSGSAVQLSGSPGIYLAPACTLLALAAVMAICTQRRFHGDSCTGTRSTEICAREPALREDRAFVRLVMCSSGSAVRLSGFPGIYLAPACTLLALAAVTAICTQRRFHGDLCTGARSVEICAREPALREARAFVRLAVRSSGSAVQLSGFPGIYLAPARTLLALVACR
ncbi:hypothetical protein GCM10022275_12410 [Tessaracoccus defluvii]